MRGEPVIPLSLLERRRSASFVFGASLSKDVRISVGEASGMADSPEDAVVVVAREEIETAVSEGEVIGEP